MREKALIKSEIVKLGFLIGSRESASESFNERRRQTRALIKSKGSLAVEALVKAK